MNLCEQCIPYGHSRHWGAGGARCPLCNSGLEYLASSEDIPPFWTQIGHFFRYPLHANCLVTIATVAVVGILIPYLGIIGVLISLFLLASAVKYGFLILETRAQNILEPPSVDKLLDGDEDYLFAKLMVTLLVCYGAAYLLAGENKTALFALNSLIGLLIPAITIVLAIEKTIVQALNPLILLQFVLRVGWAYLLMWLCYQIVSSGPELILSLLHRLPYFLSMPLTISVSMYFWCVANCMLGYSVYQYHDELGHTSNIVRDDDDNVSKAEFERKRTLADANILIREKDPRKARGIVRPMLDRFPRDKELHGFYHRVLGVVNDREALKNHADDYIDLLLEDGAKSEAVTVYLDTVTKIPNYQPHSVSTAYRLAQILEARGQKQAIVKLLNNIHKIEPGHADVPAAYFLLARIYREHLGKDEMAEKIIDFLLKHYSSSPIRRELLAYKKSIVA